MKEHPILFSAPMVRAILDGRKTQTRRVMKPQPDRVIGGFPAFDDFGDLVSYPMKYRKGDRLWVRETFTVESNFNMDDEASYPPPFRDDRPIRRVEDEDFGNYWQQCHYRASDPKPELVNTDGDVLGWKPSIFMPRWASRITLEITDIRIERLRLITESDAIAEGVDFNRPPMNSAASGWKHYRSGFSNATNAVHSFETLWEKINGEDSLASNPFVWVITFIRLKTEK